MQEASAATEMQPAPAPESAAPRRTERSLAQEIEAAFEQPIKRPRVGIFYQLGLLIVAVLMILLPLIYLALIGCVLLSSKINEGFEDFRLPSSANIMD